DEVRPRALPGGRRERLHRQARRCREAPVAVAGALAQIGRPVTPTSDIDLELDLLLEAIHRRFHHDFRSYSRSSLRRRVEQARIRFECATISDLLSRLLHDERVFPALLQDLTVQVTDLFRDPRYFRTLREEIVPLLRTYPSVRVWVAGCSTGEEAYSI